MIRLRSLGSGSSGNATLIEARGLRTRRLLVDCGLGPKVLAQRLARCGLDIGDLDAVFITHEHSDHIGQVHKIATVHKLPVWMSEGTWRAGGGADFAGLLRFCADGQRIDMGELEVHAFSVPHDAAEPLQLTCDDGAQRIGILTDLGHAPESVVQHLSSCQVLMLECNHDTELLTRSSYPEFLKRRIAGDRGHLSNEQAAQIAGMIQKGQLEQVVAAHLSRSNNRAALALSALERALGSSTELSVADAEMGTDWIDPA